MSQEEQEASTEAAEENLDLNLDSIMNKVLPSGAKALKPGPLFEREKLTFPVDASTCQPNAFPGSFKLTVVALTHQEEIEATRLVKAPTDLPFMLGKRSLFEFNGKLLDDKKRNFLFEALGPRGRQLVLAAYGEINAVGDEALAKLHSEWEV